MNYEIYSIESYKNFFCYTGYDYTHDCYYQFSFGCGYNDMNNLHKHLLSNIMHIGFNNLCVFYPVLHNFIQNFTSYRISGPDYTAQTLNMLLEEYIANDNFFIKDSEKFIKQIDLFRILHYNNKSLATSLADIKFHLGMNIISKPKLEYASRGDTYDILLHSTNNTQAITGLFRNLIGISNNPNYKDRNIIQARFNIRNQLGVPCINYSDSKLGEQIVLKTYCKEKEIDYYDIKDKRTNRYGIKFSECVPNLEFINDEFKGLKNYYNSFIMTNFEVKPEKRINANNIVLTFGAGGVHGSSKPGKYISDDEYTYLDLDISSYYPTIICNLGIHPGHFDEDFTKIYKSEIVDKRFAELENENPNQTLIYTLKKASNSCFGKMGDPDSPLYDYLAFYKTVVGAQLYTAYWIDQLISKFPLEFVFVNTDGMIIKVKKSILQDVMEFNRLFAKENNFHVKQDIITRMYMKDMNNYSLQYELGNYKNRGIFEFNREFHKDPSARIVPIALFNFFMKDIPFEETISKWDVIDDFCIRIKVRSNNKVVYKGEELFKTNRYFVSNNKEDVILKEVNRELLPLNRLYNQTLLNRIPSHYAKDYNINFKYYVLECRKVVDSIMVKQLELF